MDIAARQVARPPCQQRQRVPDLAFEMEDRVDEVVPDRAEAAVNVGALAAIMAMRAGEAGSAVEAARRRVAVRLAATMARPDRPRPEAPGQTGRAPRRDKVCPFCDSLVGARTLKKKTGK